jgi:hypothetical protein
MLAALLRFDPGVTAISSIANHESMFGSFQVKSIPMARSLASPKSLVRNDPVWETSRATLRITRTWRVQARPVWKNPCPFFLGRSIGGK